MRFHRILPWVAGVVAIWVIAAMVLSFVLQEYQTKDSVGLTPVVAYAAALLALAGWMVQAYLSVRTSRKQHSINVLFQTRMSPEYQKNLECVNNAFRAGRPIQLAVVNAEENRHIFNATVFILNYYEFISVGIAHGDLDESIIRDCIRSQLLSFTGRAAEFIRHARGEDENGRPDPARAHTYRDLCRVRSRWKASLWSSTGTWP